jgi:hypothetical protein
MSSLFFPEEPRHFPGQRGLKVSARALHVLCAGTWVGGWLLGVEPGVRDTWLWSALATGVWMLALDLYESGAFLLQVRGAVLLIKLVALACLPAFGDYAPSVLAALVVLAVLSSHAPSGVRYRLLVGAGRVQGAQTKG